MGIRIQFDVDPELVKPKLDDLDIDTVSFETDIKVPTADRKPVSQTGGRSDASAQELGYKWKSWSLNLSLENVGTIVEKTESFLEILDSIVKKIVIIMKILRLLSSDLKSFSVLLKFLLKLIVKQLKEFIESLASTGLYVSFISPDFDKKTPKFTIPVFGGYQEFIKRVNVTCLNSTDPDAPQFDDPSDTVGGVILAMLAGTNDPSLLADMLHNFCIIGQFFGFDCPNPSPPKNVKARAGLYRNSNTTSKGKELGIKLSWEPPETPVTGYAIYRDTSPMGILNKNKGPDGKDHEYRTYETFLQEVEAIPGRSRYTYTDFDITEGDPRKPNRYYYKIYSLVGLDFLENNPTIQRVQSPIASPTVSAVARNCIPISELDKYTLVTVNGELALPINLEGDWKTLTVRNMLGKPLDNLFRRMDALADKLGGLVTTGSDAASRFIKLLEKRVGFILKIVKSIKEVIERLLAFSLRGTFMCLTLAPEEGGMMGFVERFNEAANTPTTQTDLSQEKDTPIAVSTDGGIAQYNDQGIMFGVILLYGFPTINPDRLKRLVLPEETKQFEKKLEASQKAIETLLNLLGLGG